MTKANDPYILITEQTASIKGYILGVRLAHDWGGVRPFDVNGDLEPIMERIVKIEEQAERIKDA
jgi:hypothetical protein